MVWLIRTNLGLITLAYKQTGKRNYTKTKIYIGKANNLDNQYKWD